MSEVPLYPAPLLSPTRDFRSRPALFPVAGHVHGRVFALGTPDRVGPERESPLLSASVSNVSKFRVSCQQLSAISANFGFLVSNCQQCQQVSGLLSAIVSTVALGASRIASGQNENRRSCFSFLVSKCQQCQQLSAMMLTSEYGTCMSVVARFWPWISGKSL